MTTITCEGLVTYLSSYIDNELDEELAEAARAHLATCGNCRVVLNTTQRLILIGKGQRQRVLPAASRRAMFDRLRSALEARDAER